MPADEWTPVDFDRRTNSPSEWLFVADDLLAAGRFLCEHSYHLSTSWGSIQERFPTFDELRITPVILMLRSMAIECLLKGVYVKLCGPLAKGGRYLPVRGAKGHDLAALATVISKAHDLGLSAPELDYLARLSRNLVRGRYPVHKTWTHHLLPLAGGSRRRTRLMLPAHDDHDDDLFQVVSAKLRGFLREEAIATYGASAGGSL